MRRARCAADAPAMAARSTDARFAWRRPGRSNSATPCCPDSSSACLCRSARRCFGCNDRPDRRAGPFEPVTTMVSSLSSADFFFSSVFGESRSPATVRTGAGGAVPTIGVAVSSTCIRLPTARPDGPAFCGTGPSVSCDKRCSIHTTVIRQCHFAFAFQLRIQRVADLLARRNGSAISTSTSSATPAQRRAHVAATCPPAARARSGRVRARPAGSTTAIRIPGSRAADTATTRAAPTIQTGATPAARRSRTGTHRAASSRRSSFRDALSAPGAASNLYPNGKCSVACTLSKVCCQPATGIAALARPTRRPAARSTFGVRHSTPVVRVSCRACTSSASPPSLRRELRAIACSSANGAATSKRQPCAHRAADAIAREPAVAAEIEPRFAIERQAVRLRRRQVRASVPRSPSFAPSPSANAGSACHSAGTSAWRGSTCSALARRSHAQARRRLVAPDFLLRPRRRGQRARPLRAAPVARASQRQRFAARLHLHVQLAVGIEPRRPRAFQRERREAFRQHGPDTSSRAWPDTPNTRSASSDVAGTPSASLR